MLTAVLDPSSHGQRANTTSSRSALHWGAFWEGERCSYHQLGQQQEGANPPAGGSALSSAEHPQLLLLPRELQRQELDEPELLMGSQAEERGDGTWTTGTWHCSSLRDQHNLQGDQETPHLSCCCCWDSSLTPHVELGLGLGFFFPSAAFYLISPLSSIPRSSGLQTTASSTLPTTSAITLRCCQMPLGLQPRGKSGLSKANCFIC